MALYFPHICKTDKVSVTIKILEEKYGNDGYAFWFKLLEILAKQENNFLDLSNPQNAGMLISYMNMDKEKVKKILSTIYHDCYQFDNSLFEKGILFVPRLKGSVKKIRGPSKVDAASFLLDDNKKEYAPSVNLTEEEYGKLLVKFGGSETHRSRAIEILSAYKNQSIENRNRYDSDYFAILNWVVDKVNKELQRPMAQGKKESVGAHKTSY